MAIPVPGIYTLTASGNTQLTQAGNGAGPDGWLLTFIGIGWTGSLVLKSNQNPPGGPETLTNVGYYNGSTYAPVSAGTAITATTLTYFVRDTAYDLWAVYTHTAGTVTLVVSPANNASQGGTAPGGPTAAGDVTAGTFGSFTGETGAYAFPGAFSAIGNFTSAAGKIGLGTTPGTVGAINVDHAAYTGPTVIAIGAITTPSAYAVTTSALFPSTVSGAVLMGFGTTGDVTLKNRAGTSVLYVEPNGTLVNVITGTAINQINGSTIGTSSSDNLVIQSGGVARWTFARTASTSTIASSQATAVIVGGATSTTLYQSNGSTVAYQYLAAGAVGIGTAAVAQNAIRQSNTATATGALAIGYLNNATLVAAANSDVLDGLRIDLTWTPASFTGLQTNGINILARSVAAFTSPGTATMLSIGVLTGTGASVATALQLAPPTGASTNYLIAHTTAATFNVTAAGVLSSSNIGVGATAGSADVGVNVSGTAILTAGTSQYSFKGSATFGSGATTAGYGFHSAGTTAASAYTMVTRAGFYSANVAKGAASAITNDYGIYVEGPTQGATLNVSAGLHLAVAVPATAGAVAAGTPIRCYSTGVTIEWTSDAPTHVRVKGSVCYNINGSSGITRGYINTDGSTGWTAITTVG